MKDGGDVLVRIKRAVLQGRTRFSKKALLEMEADRLTELDIEEAILNAHVIYKKIRSHSPHRAKKVEYLYVLQSTNLDGIFIYTKGKFLREGNTEIFYFLISAKKSV
ncbi:MAG: hypothetical protein JST85_03025 [Acidobacteria bacterium]|nr:hypothetical protein [Acidobacteriota bacterium]